MSEESDVKSQQVTVTADPGLGPFRCPERRTEVHGYDRNPRRWRRLDACPSTTSIVANVSRIRYLARAVRQFPWRGHAGLRPPVLTSYPQRTQVPGHNGLAESQAAHERPQPPAPPRHHRRPGGRERHSPVGFEDCQEVPETWARHDRDPYRCGGLDPNPVKGREGSMGFDLW